REARGIVYRPMYLDDAVRGVSCPLVQAVDVLRDEREELASPLERHERAMTGVGRRRPRRMLEPGAPGRAADFGVGDIVMDVRELLGRGIGRPEPVGAPEIRDSRVSGYARSGQRDDAVRAVDPVANAIDVGEGGVGHRSRRL